METFSWNALTSISYLVAVVIKGLMIWGSKPKQFSSGYVKYEEAEVDRLVVILKTNNCGGGGTCEIQEAAGLGCLSACTVFLCWNALWYMYGGVIQYKKTNYNVCDTEENLRSASV